MNCASYDKLLGLVLFFKHQILKTCRYMFFNDRCMIFWRLLSLANDIFLKIKLTECMTFFIKPVIRIKIFLFVIFCSVKEGSAARLNTKEEGNSTIFIFNWFYFLS